MALQTHKDLKVWQQSKNLVSEIYKLTATFPKEEIYSLTAQIKRSAISIPSNIAEGAARESNKEYRDKISETPLNYRTVRRELQALVDSNNESITDNDTRISNIDKELNSEINKLQTEQESEQSENEDKDISNILLFLIISTSIEFIIILGIYFDKYYDYNVYLSNIGELENTHKKRDRYRTLIKFIFKEGMLGQDQQILGKTKLLNLIKEKSTIPSPNKFLANFLNDMEYLNILKLNGTRRYTAVTYQDALEKIDKFDDTLRLLEKLN